MSRMSDFVLTRLMPPTACGPTGCQPAHAFHGLPGVLTLLGDGNDVLDLQYAPANRFYADGGAGLDKLLRTYDAPTGSFKAVGFENLCRWPVQARRPPSQRVRRCPCTRPPRDSRPPSRTGSLRRRLGLAPLEIVDLVVAPSTSRLACEMHKSA
jgi:hypothetical protein